ncbi:MAG TPA: helix-turn-helix transcriptional regulator [Methylomirabilota bacterium]|nr:helix-turn-helix transcriptional regulator [Methylomirabilota bacterium]
MDALSPRQRQVLEGIARGRTTKEIAYALGIRERTVKWHISRVIRNLGANSRSEAIAIAFEQGLLRDLHGVERDS